MRRSWALPILVSAAIVSSLVMIFAYKNPGKRNGRLERRAAAPPPVSSIAKQSVPPSWRDETGGGVAAEATPAEHRPPILSPPSVPLGPIMTSRDFQRRLSQHSVEEKPREGHPREGEDQVS